MPKATKPARIGDQLSRRLLPLAVGIGLLITVLGPSTYWMLESRNFQCRTDLYAGGLAEKIQEFVLESPDLWKYQTYRFLPLTKQFNADVEMGSLLILDEAGKPIANAEFRDGRRQRPGELSFLERLSSARGEAPIIFNNRRLGTVVVSAVNGEQPGNTGIFLATSSLVGLFLAVLVFRFPVRVVKSTEKRLRRATEFARTVLDSVNDAIAIIDTGDFRVLGCNAAFLDQVRLSEAEVVGKRCFELTHGRCDPCRSPGEPCPLLETVATGKHAAADHLHVLGGKRKIVVEISTSPIFDDQGQVARVVHVTRDISERKLIETMLTEQARKLEQLALIDALTGLNNRRGFLTLAGQQLRIADRFGKRLHLLFADLDGMKWINDTLGHSEGDRALRETAELLRRTFRESDILARIGGDEFAVLALGEDKSEEGTIRSRFEEQLVAHNDSADRGYRLSISIGITVYDPSVPCSIEQLLDRGDALMYEQKRLQKQCDPR